MSFCKYIYCHMLVLRLKGDTFSRSFFRSGSLDLYLELLGKTGVAMRKKIYSYHRKCLSQQLIGVHRAEGASMTEMDELTNFSFYDSSNFTYVDDYIDEVCDKGNMVIFGTTVIPIFSSLVIILSLTGNILVLMILALYENLKSLTNIFILNLAISDLVFTAGLPFWPIYHIQGWFFPELLCKIVTFVFFTGFYSSILFLTIMTVYRYLAVVHPLSDLSTPKHSIGVFLSVLMWIISIGAAMPSLLFSSITPVHHKDKETQGCEYSDSLWGTVGVLQQNAFFLVSFAVMTFCYIQILERITRTRSHTKNRAVKLLFFRVVVFFIGWVPYNVVIFLRVLPGHVVPLLHECDTSIQLDYAFYVCRLIAFSHCCLNPVFYAFVGVKFKSQCRLECTSSQG